MHRFALAVVIVAVCLVAKGSAPQAADDPHAYFQALTPRADCYRAYSLRPLATETTPIKTTHGVADCTHSRYVNQIPSGAMAAGGMSFVTYNVAGDTDPQRQDGVKVRIPVFDPIGLWEADTDSGTAQATIAENITSSQTTFLINRGGQNFENGKSWLVGGPWPSGEIMTQTGRVDNTVTVLRGQFGTTAKSHSTGTTVQRNNNTLMDARRALPIHTDGRVSARYLLTWDTYWTDSYVNQGLVAHKLNQITSHAEGQQLMEYKPLYGGQTNPNFNETTDVGALTMRWYSQSLTPGFFQEPGAPIRDQSNNPTHGFLIKPNRWTRAWLLVEANSETDNTKFVNSGQTLVTPGGIDASTSSLTISHMLGSAVWYLGGTTRTNVSNPFTTPQLLQGATYPGRVIRIDNEIMTIVSGPVTGDTRLLTVLRGQNGTMAASHAQGAPVQVIDDYVTLWMADENTDARMIVNRLSLALPTDHATAELRGSLGSFWIEFNTSQQQLPPERAQSLSNARKGDLVAYQRNLVVLRNPGDVASLLLRPSGGVPPPFTGLLAPGNLRIIK